MTLTARDILFAAGGLCLERFGVPTLRRAPSNRGGEELKETFARAASANAGYYLDRDGVLRKAGTDILRPHFLDPLLSGTRSPYLLTERAGENRFLRSQELDNAAWTKIGSSVSANALTAPDGTVTADKLVEGAAGTNHQFQQNVTITADATVVYSHYAAAGERSIIRLFILDSASQTKGCRAEYNLATGVASGLASISTGTGVAAAIERVSGGYRCVLVGKIDAGNTAAQGMARLLSAAGVDSYSGDGTSGAYFWGAQFEDSVAVPSSYILTTTASATRAVDKLSISFDRQPMAMSVYAAIREEGLVNTTSGFGRIWQIAESSGSNRVLNLRLNTATGKYSTAHEITGGAGVSSSLAAAPVYGDYVELLVTLFADGSVQISQSIGGAAITQGAASAAFALASSWGSNHLILGGTVVATGAINAPNSLRLIAGARGSGHSIADFRSYWRI